MTFKIKGEHNFFLFQDIVEYFLLYLQRKWYLPISNKHKDKNYPYYNASYYIFDSWYELFIGKVLKAEYTELGKWLIANKKDWVYATNVGILTAQKALGRRDLSWKDENYIREHKPKFEVEHQDNYETYIINLEGDMLKTFKEAVSFWECFDTLEVEKIYQQLSRYFVLTEDIKTELSVVCENYSPTDRKDRCLNSYEIEEDE